MDPRPGRLERLLAEITRPRQAEHAEPEEHGALERAARWLGSALGSMGRAQEAFESLRARGLDQVVGAGQYIELEASLDPVRQRLAREVHFSSGTLALGKAKLDERGRARCVLQVETPGVYVVSAHVFTDGGTGLGEISGGAGRLLVVGDAPTLAVDVALLGAPGVAGRLEEFASAGVEWVYVALAPLTDPAIRRALERGDLPLAPMLGLDPSTRKLPTLGVDFRPAFARTLIRRMRASGVALAGLVSADVRIESRREGIPSMHMGLAEFLDDATLSGVERWAQQFHERRRAVNDDLRFRLDEATATRAVPGNSCHVELDNGAAREAVLGAIAGAQREVLLSVYILEEGRFADALAYALVGAARRGVQVRMLVDALYSRQDVLGVTNAVVDGLSAEPGVEVLATRPIPSLDSLDPLLLKERDHRKLLVIDGERAFVSGRNAGDAYYTGLSEVYVTDFSAHEHLPWLDAHVELRGPLTREVAASFRKAFLEAGGGDFELMPECPQAGGSCARLVIHHGVGDANAMMAYEAILDAATDHVFILNDFPMVDTLAAAVRRAVARGVTVTLLTGSALARRLDGSFFRGPLHREAFEYMTKRRLVPLIEAGVNVVEVVSPADGKVLARGGVYRPYVHAKLMSADGRVVSVGSANLDATASYWEQEAIAVIEDTNVAAEVEAELHILRERGVPLDPTAKSFEDEAPLRELASRLWPDSLYS